MMKFTGVFLLVLIMVSCYGSSAFSGCGIPVVGSVTTQLTDEASIYVLPSGAGAPLNEGMYFGGEPANARVDIVLVDSYWVPVPDFPSEDMWLSSEASTYMVCPGVSAYGFMPDQNTNAHGESHFENPLNGGGWSEGPLWFYCNGNRATTPDEVELPPVPIRFNSPDINADGIVSLADVSLFATNFFGEYHYRSDYHWDGILNLSDVAMMASGVGTACD